MRGITQIGLLLAAVGLGLLAARPAYGIGRDEAAGVQSRRGNPSPSAAESNVNEYTFQDEQINIDGGKDSIVKVLRVNQKNLVNDFVVATFPIHRAHPKEIRQLFRLITGKEGGRAEVIRDKVKKEYFLQVIAPEFQLPYIEQTLRAIDVPWIKEDLDGSHQSYYRAMWRDVADIDTLADVPGGSDGQTTVIDETANAVFKRGEPYRIGKYVKTAELVDVFPPQMALEVAVYEVELSSDLKLGLDFVNWKCGPGDDLFRFVNWSFSEGQSADEATSIFDPFQSLHNVVPGTRRLDARGHGYFAGVNWLVTAEYLDFLVRKGKARLVTTGRVNVRNATVGEMSVTDEVLHFQVDPDEEDLLTDDGETAGDFLEQLQERCLTHRTGDVNVGLNLTLAPFIGLETSELVYALTMSDITGATPAGTPIVRSNTVLGTVLARDGMPICVGGLKRNEENRSTAKIPVLGSIPVLGYLFGGEQNSDRETEMVVVLRPDIALHNEVHEALSRPEDAELRKQVRKQLPLHLPETEYGFDQWLLGEEG